MIHTIPAFCLVGALVALSCASACANTSADAALSELRITLVDLMPDDGIAPAVTFRTPWPGPGNGAAVAVSSASGSTGADNFYSDNDASTPPFGSVALALPPIWPATAGAAQIAGDPSAAGQSARAWSSAQAGGYAEASTSAGNRELYFSLSPGTQMIMSATADTTVSMTDAALESKHSYANAAVSLSLYLNASVDYARGSLYTRTNGRADQAVHDQQFLHLSVSNSGSDWSDGDFSESVASDSFSLAPTISVVPEPGTPALWLAGLGLVGALARRRTGTAAKPGRGLT